MPQQRQNAYSRFIHDTRRKRQRWDDTDAAIPRVNIKLDGQSGPRQWPPRRRANAIPDSPCAGPVKNRRRPPARKEAGQRPLGRALIAR